MLVSLAAMDDRPPPEPAKLLEEWMEWERGDELPGRVMANLKKGQFAVLLDEEVDDPTVAAIVEAWKDWERGKANPADVLGRLRTAGVADLLKRLAV